MLITKCTIIYYYFRTYIHAITYFSVAYIENNLEIIAIQKRFIKVRWVFLSHIWSLKEFKNHTIQNLNDYASTCVIVQYTLTHFHTHALLWRRLWVCNTSNQIMFTLIQHICLFLLIPKYKLLLWIRNIKWNLLLPQHPI